MTSNSSAADIGLPSNIIAFLPCCHRRQGSSRTGSSLKPRTSRCASRGSSRISTMPAWTRAIEELVRRNRCGAATIIQENAAAIRVLYTSTDSA